MLTSFARKTIQLSISLESLPDYAGDRVFLALPDIGSDALEGRTILDHLFGKTFPLFATDTVM
ncbi:MAG: hypothetical protein K0R67_3945 [Paenibacillus sp.]|nr:hypothetical protein [Paenibacillus sp.]